MTEKDKVVSADPALDTLCAEYWAFSCYTQPVNALLAGEQIDEPVLYRESPADHAQRANGARELLKRGEALGDLKIALPVKRLTHFNEGSEGNEC